MGGAEQGLDEGSRWVGRAAVLLLLVALLGIGLISAGVFDPKPLGEFVTSLPVERLAVEAGESRLHWLDMPLPPAPYSLHLTAALADGETNMGYGLALGDETDYVVAAVSPLGYVTVSNCQLSMVNCQLAMEQPVPWQTWPHVRPGVNEIWLDVADNQLTVRINREWLWQGEVETGSGVALWLASNGEAATVQFQELTLFTPTPN